MFGGRAEVPQLRTMLGELVDGTAASVAFTLAREQTWALPLYELALMTASHLRDHGSDARVMIVTPEDEPLGLFGPPASAAVREMLSAVGIARLADMVPVVTLAGSPTPASLNVRCDNGSGIRALVRHLVLDHGYRSLGYVSGRADSPDNRTRSRAFENEAAAVGATIDTGPAWQGNYSAAGGANVIETLLDSRKKLPRAILCANDQTALGVIHALAQRGIKVPQDVAITGFDDVPVARHLHPPLTTIRQPMQELGAKAFDILYSRISEGGGNADTVLPVELVVRESCGCAPGSTRVSGTDLVAKDGHR